MRGCKRGPLRLMGMLPPRTPVAHKTGSLTSYTCDIGIITLPHEAGHIAISVYIEDSVMDLANNERAIAEVSRMLFDFYLFSN
jgi:beta-lactamase class A